MAHASARLTPLGRRLLVDRIGSGWTITRASYAAGISRQTGSKWWSRFQREGNRGLDREVARRGRGLLDSDLPSASR
jgi:transposase